MIEGMGEVIKYGLIEDPELWALLTELDGSVESILEHAETLIEHSCQVKRKMVVEDEFGQWCSPLPQFWPYYWSCY